MYKKNVKIKIAKKEVFKAIDLFNKYEGVPEPKVLWNGVIEGASGLITGVAKTGKTTFAENLAVAFASGKKEFFRFELDGAPKRVLFLNLEEKERRIARRMTKMVKSLSEEERSNFNENYFLGQEDFPQFLNEESDWKLLRDYILEVKPNIVFFDSLTHMCVGEIEQSRVAQSFIQNFRDYFSSIDDNITYFVIHHNTKGNDKPMEQANIAGSRIITQEFDFAIGLSNIPTEIGGRYCTTVYNKDSDSDNTGFLYEFDESSWVQNVGRGNVYSFYKEVKHKTDGRVDDTNRNNILDYFKHQDTTEVKTGELFNEFVATHTISKQTMQTALNKLCENGAINRTNRGVYTLNQEVNGGDSLQSSQSV